MEFLSLSRRRLSARNVPSGEERGETDIFAGYRKENPRKKSCCTQINGVPYRYQFLLIRVKISEKIEWNGFANYGTMVRPRLILLSIIWSKAHCKKLAAPPPYLFGIGQCLCIFLKFSNALLMIRAFRMSFICRSSVVFIIITHRNNFQGSFCTKLSHLPRQRNHIQRKQYFLLCLQAPLEVGFLFLSSDSSYRVRAKTHHSSYQIRACSHSILAENQLNRLIFSGSRSNLHQRLFDHRKHQRRLNHQGQLRELRWFFGQICTVQRSSSLL